MESELFRPSPHDNLAEQSILGAMMIDPDTIPKVITSVKADDFYSDTNRTVYEAICGMFSNGEGIDPVTVASALKGDVKDADQLIIGIVSLTPTAKNVEQYIKAVTNSSTLRSVLSLADNIIDNANNNQDTNVILDSIDNTLRTLRDKKASGLMRASLTIPGVFNEISELSKNKTLPGISTGFSELDGMISGLNKGELILLASRPGMGKTSLALNMAMRAAKKGCPTAVFSLEMSTGQLIRRLLSGESYVDASKLRTGSLSKDEWSKLSSAVAVISNAELYIDDNSMASVADIHAQCRKIKNLGLVVIDYLQLMASGNTESRQQAVSEISRSLKVMAKELNVPVLCLSQLSRESAKRSDKRPTLSDLRESGSLEQDADIVLGIYRKDYFDREASAGEAELLVMKNRNGMVGTVDMMWLPQYTTYVAAAKTSDSQA